MGNQIKYYCKKARDFLFGNYENVDALDTSANPNTIKLLKTEKSISKPSKLRRLKKMKSKSIEINLTKATNVPIFNKDTNDTNSIHNSADNNDCIINIKNAKNAISIEDFKLIATIGKGAFGKVKFVKYLRDGKYYAMKVLKKDLIRRTKQIDHTKSEKRIMQLIDNEFIVKLFFSFQSADRLYMVMEFMQGGELFFHLKQQRKFDEDRTRLYACEIIVALEHLHKNQIIYRDLKPENILLDISGHIKLTDFGLSKMVLDEEDEIERIDGVESINSSSSTTSIATFKDKKAFTICGTPEYLCPEILGGKGYDKTVDWWSLGVLIYEMISGSSPFRNINKKKLDLSSYFKPIKFNKNFSEEAESLITGLLQTDYTKRLGYGYNDADDIKSHEFFDGIIWDDVYKRKLKHPFKPHVDGPEDLSYFDMMFTSESPRESYINESRYPSKTDVNYDRFTFVRDDV